jgi:hypothetical protein
MERRTLKLNELGGIANARIDLFGPPLAEFMKRTARGLIRINACRFDIRLFDRIFSGLFSIRRHPIIIGPCIRVS